MDTWKLLRKELAFFGVEIVNDNACRCADHDSGKVVTIKRKIRSIEKEIHDNLDLFQSTCHDLNEMISSPLVCSEERSPVDLRLERLFIYAVKDLIVLSEFLCDSSGEYRNAISKEESFNKNLVKLSNTDICDISNDVVKYLPQFKLAIAWVFRRNSVLSYIAKLLTSFRKGEKAVSSLEVKTAKAGVSGPWSNLSMPLQERAFGWDGIEEEVRGRDRDLRRQRRYQQGLENYNNDGRVGEGYFWREIRNEPFEWADRKEEDPYPHRSILSG